MVHSHKYVCKTLTNNDLYDTIIQRKIMKITTATQQGPRPYQEDRYGIIHFNDGGTLLAVFDGHGGNAAADTASEYLRTLNLLYTEGIKQNLQLLFKKLDSLTEYFDAGTTASLVYITPNKDKAYVCILGDSPVVIMDRDLTLWNSPEHNVRTNAIEESRAIARGGAIYRGYVFDAQGKRGLQLSRALGDRFLRHILSQEPEIFTINLGPSSWIVVGSDGLLDPAHTQTHEKTKQLKQMMAYDAEASQLVNRSILDGSHDNVTAIVARMNAIGAQAEVV